MAETKEQYIERIKKRETLQPVYDPTQLDSGLDKITQQRDANLSTTPGVPTQTASTKTLEPVNKPTLNDFITEAQKLSYQKSQAQADQLAEQTKGISETFARDLYGKNVGATSGVGRELTGRAIQDQAERLEPYAREEAARLGELELNMSQERTSSLYNQVISGNVDKSQMSSEDWAAMGITDPEAVRTLTDVDFRNAMVADGLNPDNPQDVSSYTTSLRTAKTDQLKQQIIANYSAVNDGRVPSVEEQEMMMYAFGSGKGYLSVEEENAIIAKYNDDQWTRTIQKAEAMNPPAESDKGGTVLCTELHRQGLLSEKIYRSDSILGEYYAKNYPTMVSGYHFWGVPLAKLMRKSKLATFIMKPFITAWAKQMHYELTKEGKPILFGKLIQFIGIPICSLIGKLIRRNISWKLV